jgi:hypothetical protein
MCATAVGRGDKLNNETKDISGEERGSETKRRFGGEEKGILKKKILHSPTY